MSLNEAYRSNRRAYRALGTCSTSAFSASGSVACAVAAPSATAIAVVFDTSTSSCERSSRVAEGGSSGAVMVRIVVTPIVIASCLAPSW